MTWHLLHKNAFYPICLYITCGTAWSVCRGQKQLQPQPTCCKLLYAEVNGLLWINNTLRFIFCDLNIAHLILPFRGWGPARGWGRISPLVITHGCARGDVSSCSRPINGLSRNLDTRPRGDTETRRRGYADNITHDHGTPGHRAPGSWHNGLGLRRSLVTVQI